MRGLLALGTKSKKSKKNKNHNFVSKSPFHKKISLPGSSIIEFSTFKKLPKNKTRKIHFKWLPKIDQNCFGDDRAIGVKKGYGFWLFYIICSNCLSIHCFEQTMVNLKETELPPILHLQQLIQIVNKFDNFKNLENFL